MPRRNKSRGGGTPWPLSYFSLSSTAPATANVRAGSDLLGTSNSTVRPAITITGGKRSTRRANKSRKPINHVKAINHAKSAVDLCYQ